MSDPRRAQAEEARRAQRANLIAFMRWTGRSSPGAQVMELPGVTAAVVPAAPLRSVVNSVTFEDAEALASACDALAGAYAGAGVRGWTVWVPQHDGEAIALLRERGHRFDGEPVAMSLSLAELEPPGDELDWDDAGTPAELGALNDAAYGYEDGGYTPAMGRGEDGLPLRIYRARVDGETASVLATIDIGDDIGIYWVATPAPFRGRGLAGRLLARALTQARERGLRTSSLQASALGRPVYERLGYRPLFDFHLYERREAG